MTKVCLFRTVAVPHAADTFAKPVQASVLSNTTLEPWRFNDGSISGFSVVMQLSGVVGIPVIRPT
jgi:hypothetical protein